MKKFILVLSFLAILVSCNKETDNRSQLPQWLQDKITTEEAEIAANPTSVYILGAWMIYSYQGASFFEYHNNTFSSLPKVYYYDGTEMPYSGTIYTDYQEGKCCKQFIWKGADYVDY